MTSVISTQSQGVSFSFQLSPFDMFVCDKRRD
jgi:hypothetical protein